MKTLIYQSKKFEVNLYEAVWLSKFEVKDLETNDVQTLNIDLRKYKVQSDKLTDEQISELLTIKK